jgi:Fe-S cluster biogenesis protein NfuA
MMDETLQETTTVAEASPSESNGESKGATVVQLAEVQAVLDAVRPFLQADGGDCELVDLTPDGVVKLRLHGACGACPSSTYTLKLGIEEQLKQHIPYITAVEQVM